MPDVAKIRELNDLLRTKGVGGKIAITSGVMALGDLPTILQQLRDFNDFRENNSPHQENDFGAFKYKGRPDVVGEGPLIFFKLDYYDKELMMGSPDPANPVVTARVCTVMLAAEY